MSELKTLKDIDGEGYGSVKRCSHKELKSELKEIERRRDELEIETDIIITEDNRVTKNEISKDGKLWVENYNELEKLKIEISTLKKGISACEELEEEAEVLKHWITCQDLMINDMEKELKKQLTNSQGKEQ